MRNDPSQISKQTDIKVLETLMAYYEYLKAEQEDKVKPELLENVRVAQVTRARLGGTTDFPPIQTPSANTNQPDLAHDSRKFNLYQKVSTAAGTVTALEYRTGLHDLLNRDQGFEPTFSIYGLSAALGYSYQRKRLELDRVDLFNIESMQSIRGTEQPMSWRIHSGWIPWNERGPDFDTVFRLHIGGGAVYEPVISHLWIGFFVGPATKFDALVRFKDSFLVEVEPFAYWRIDANSKLKLSLNSESAWHFGKHGFSAKADFSKAISDQSEFRLGIQPVFRSYILSQSNLIAQIGVGYFF